jgi:hypothetical protein
MVGVLLTPYLAFVRPVEMVMRTVLGVEEGDALSTHVFVDPVGGNVFDTAWLSTRLSSVFGFHGSCGMTVARNRQAQAQLVSKHLSSKRSHLQNAMILQAGHSAQTHLAEYGDDEDGRNDGIELFSQHYVDASLEWQTRLGLDGYSPGVPFETPDPLLEATIMVPAPHPTVCMVPFRGR